MNSEATLLSALQEIKKASFWKTSLEFFAKVPETTTLILKTRVSSDNEKILATQVYLELLNKLSYFANKVAKKEVTPNEEELDACEKCIATIYNNDKDFPMTWRGISLLLIMFGGLVLLVWFIAYKRKKS